MCFSFLTTGWACAKQTLTLEVEQDMVYKITALTLQKRNRQRVNVYLDGEYAFGLVRIVAAWLSVGQEISDEKIAELKAQDEYEVAYQHALKLLDYRPRAEREIRQNLEKKGTREEVILPVLERLKNAGLVNDGQFAHLWVENRSDLHPRSRRALSYELKMRGVSEDAIRKAVSTVDEEEMAYQAALKQARKLSNLDWQTFRQRMYAFLGRRGFNYEVSQPAATRVWQELHADDPLNGSIHDNDEL